MSVSTKVQATVIMKKVITFIPASRRKYYFQTIVYGRDLQDPVVAATVRLTPSQMTAFHLLSSRCLIRMAGLVTVRFIGLVPSQDIRLERMHKLLSAVHDVYKFITLAVMLPNEELPIAKMCDGRALIASFLSKLTAKISDYLNRITNKKCKLRLTAAIQKHFPLLIVGLIKLNKQFGELLTVFLDVKYRLPAVASLVAALDRDGCQTFRHGLRVLVMSTRNVYCDWDIVGADLWLRGLTVLLPRYH